MKKLLIALSIAAAVVWGLWLFALPEAMLAGIVKDSLKGSGVEVQGIEKGLFYNFSTGRISLSRAGREMLHMDGLSGRLDLFALPMMRLSVPFKGLAGGGTLQGRAELRRKHYRLTADMEGAALDGIISRKGTKGVVSADIRMEDGVGEVKFSVSGLQTEPVNFLGIDIPVGIFNAARGLARFKGDALEIESLSVQGDGAYARAKGTIKGNYMDLTLELMPESAAVKGNAAFALLDRYRVTDGYYAIPLKGEFRF